MRRSASEILRNLEVRIARLEKQSVLHKVNKDVVHQFFSMIDLRYGEDRHNLGGTKIIEEGVSESGETVMIIENEGYYGIVRDNGRSQYVQTVSDNLTRARRQYEKYI